MTPADLLDMSTTGAGSVLQWVGVGVGGAMLLYFAFLGIRKGFDFFGALSDGRKADAYFASAEYAADVEEERIWSEAHDLQVSSAEDLGWSVSDQFDSARVAGDLAVMKHRGEI